MKGIDVLKELDLEIEPGIIVVNDGYEVPSEYKVVHIDLKSKYADALSYGEEEGFPYVYLCIREDDNNYIVTLNIDENKKIPTKIILKDYPGWEVMNAWVGRYTLTVILERATQ